MKTLPIDNLYFQRMKRTIYPLLLLVALLIHPMAPVQAKSKKNQARQEQAETTGAHDRAVWVQFFGRFRIPSFTTWLKVPCIRICR